MDLSAYKQLSGVTVSAARSQFVAAQINRCKAMLETMLGYTLSPESVTKNLYNELGKASRECACPDVDIEDLQDPDEVVGAYRLYEYNVLDEFFHIDPFKTINKVKLVYVKPNGDGITLKTFDDDEIRSDIGRDGIGKYLEHCRHCLCVCECTNCVQLAVDADWFWGENDNIPDDLLYVLADMVTWYSNPRKDIKSESITTHSYTKFDQVAPEKEPSNMAVIQKYAGPYGTVTITPTTGGQGRRYVYPIGL